MPDISMCKGNNCLLRVKCYRYTAKAEELGQSFFSEPPYVLKDFDSATGTVVLQCDYFWDNNVNANEITN
jgi:hypothetical protein